MEGMEGLAASVARHLCHVLWYLVLLRAAFRQPIGCLAAATFIVIGIGAAEAFSDLQLRLGARKSQKLMGRKAMHSAAVIGPAPLFLRPTQLDLRLRMVCM